MAVELDHSTGSHVARRHREPLVVATAVFAVALVVHGADHLRRGMGVLAWPVYWAGNLQGLLAVITIGLVVRRHRLAPLFAVVVGFMSAVGFALAHLLPHWSAFSDSFTGAHVAAHVTGFSWFAALFEIAADLALGIVGLKVLLRRRDAVRG